MPNNLKTLYSNLLKRVTLTQKKISKRYTMLKANYKTQIDYSFGFITFMVMYGLLLAYSLSVLVPTRFIFNIKYIIALGVAFYFLKEELPTIVTKAISPK